MMNSYFGDQTNSASPGIWVEIQWPALIVDGGIVLLVVYNGALLVAMQQQWRRALSSPVERIKQLGAIIFAMSAGAFVNCFSYPVFLSPIGAQFWFFAGALYGVASRIKRLGAEVSHRPRLFSPVESSKAGIKMQ